ncbi:MAG TPA: SpoIIE family protein phosphatase [Candidatus Ozemobacteraceae bacterium]|nr:SpoIIE family protein phosphatase [Candidatus Ozemobacteraceae bacterium]
MMIDNLARSGIRKFSPHRLPLEEQGRVKPIDVLMESLCSAEELGWSQINGRPGRLLSLGVSGGRTLVYWNVFPALASGPAFMFGGQEPEHLVRNHITELAQAEQTRGEINGVFVAHLDVVPERSAAWSREMRTLAQLAERTRRVQQRQLTVDGRTVWAVAMIDSHAGRYALIHAYDATQDMKSLGRMRFGICLSIIPVLLMAWGAGLLLGDLLLHPISDLERGIEAIRSRDTSHRIPVRRDDEFGSLARLFNQSLLELKELELAREVQGSLLPRELPRINGWSIGGVNVTASDLGGDYYDLLATHEGKEWVMCVGDVTGHGASAALAMAMAKAGLTYRLNQGEVALKPLLDSLNLIFYNELRSSRKFMTMVLNRFCPATGDIEFENAGHNYPLIYRRATAVSEFVQMVGSPLGVKRKGVRDSAKHRLDPGDAVLCYTDGYPECSLSSGEFMGDEAMKQRFEELCRTGHDAASIVQHLLQDLQQRRSPGPLQDDVTLVVIKREEV